MAGIQRKRLWRAEQMTEPQVAYFAGLLDGEGCISLAHRRQYITPTLQIANTCRELLKWVQHWFTGGIYEIRNSRKDNRKQSYVWSIAGQKAQRAIKLALPYLLVKRRQAELVLGIKRFAAIHVPGHKGRVVSVMTPQDFALNASIVTQIRQLNMRGRLSCH